MSMEMSGQGQGDKITVSELQLLLPVVCETSCLGKYLHLKQMWNNNYWISFTGVGFVRGTFCITVSKRSEVSNSAPSGRHPAVVITQQPCKTSILCNFFK